MKYVYVLTTPEGKVLGVLQHYPTDEDMNEIHGTNYHWKQLTNVSFNRNELQACEPYPGKYIAQNINAVIITKSILR